MKKFLFLILALSGLQTALVAQQVSNDVFSYKLKKAAERHEKRLKKADSTQLSEYADILFALNRQQEAFYFYRMLDDKGEILNNDQKRNYVHSSLRTGGISPYYKRSDYFKTELDVIAEVNYFTANSSFEDLTPFYHKGLVLYSSSRPTARNKNRFKYPLTGMPYLDIHAADTLGREVALDFLPNGVHSSLHDGPVYLTKNEGVFFITRTRPKADKDGVHQLYITYYTKKHGKWSSEQEFPHNIKGYSVQHPWYDESNRTLYFASNQPGGAGGFDIYKSKFENDVWQQPEHLGKEVNTIYDEVFPSLSPSGDLVYATNHIETLGGLDLVMYKEGKRYLFPEPINSRYDDFGISWTANWRGYFSSNRTGGAFNDDIFSFAGYEKPVPRFAQHLRLLMADGSGELKSNQVNIVLKSSLDKDSLVLTYWDGALKLGAFKEPLPLWHLDFKLKGHYPVNQALNFQAEGDSFVAVVTITKKKPVLESKGFLAIYFQNGEPGKMTDEEAKQLDYRKFFNGYMKGKYVYYQKSASSKAELDALFIDIEKGMAELELFPARLDSALQNGRKMKVYMAAYTSASGSAAINKMISERRGTVLKNFIVNWNNGALQKYIDNGQLVVSDEYFPLSDPDEGKNKAKIKKGPAYTMFGVEASRSRRVNVVWETTAEGRPEE